MNTRTIPAEAIEAAVEATSGHEWRPGQCACGHTLTLDLESAEKLWLAHLTEITLEAAMPHLRERFEDDQEGLQAATYRQGWKAGWKAGWKDGRSDTTHSSPTRSGT